MRASMRVVFRGFDRAMARFITAGDDGLDQFRRDAKRRWTLRRIKHAQAARRSGADVEKPSARAQTLDDSVHGARDVWQNGAHGDGDAFVLAAHH